MSIEDPNVVPGAPQPVKRGMGTGVKILLILLGLGGVAALVCCGGFAYFGSKAFTLDPAKIRARTQEVTTIDIPEQLQPDRAMNMQFVQIIGYSNKGEDAFGFLILAEVSRGFVPNESAARQQLDVQVETQMQQLAEKRRAGRGVPTNHEERKVKIRGSEVTFDISEYPGSNGAPATVKVNGMFPSNGGYAELGLEASRKLLTDEQIHQMIDSIK